jgi:hypothetical protein
MKLIPLPATIISSREITRSRCLWMRGSSDSWLTRVTTIVSSGSSSNTVAANRWSSWDLYLQRITPPASSLGVLNRSPIKQRWEQSLPRPRQPTAHSWMRRNRLLRTKIGTTRRFLNRRATNVQGGVRRWRINSKLIHTSIKSDSSSSMSRICRACLWRALSWTRFRRSKLPRVAR